MDSKSLISVIIPMYNNQDTIKRTIDSVLVQSYSNIEIIVVDDGSDDESCQIVDGIDDNRIYLFRLPHKNANVARNYGINQSRGEYIAMLDADDEWTDDHLETSFDTLRASQSDGVYGSIIIRGNTDRLIETREIKNDESTIDFLLSNGYAAQTSTLFMTSSSVKDVMWDETLYRHQDYDFLVRYLRKYRMSPKIKATTVYHISHSNTRIDFESCIRFIKTVEDEISDIIYTNYHKYMLRLAVSLSASDNIVQHYRKEATYYTYLLSLYEYLHLLQPKGKLEAYIMKLRYLWRVFLIKLK